MAGAQIFLYMGGENFFGGEREKCTGYGTERMVEYGRKARKIRKHTNTYAEIFDNFVQYH